MGRADLHIHTNQGDGLDSVRTILDHVERTGALEVIAITEHDDLAVALRAREVWAKGRYTFDFVAGAEITTLDGHLIALFVEESVPSLRCVEETIDAIHAQGGLCIVPHPFSWLTRSIGPGTLSRLASSRGAGDGFDSIELATANPVSRRFLAKARRLNNSLYRLPAVGASDAHFASAVGSGFTEFTGGSANGLKSAILSGDVRGGEHAFPSLREVGLRKALALPLTGLAATPRKLGWRRTAWSFVAKYGP